MLTLAKFLKNCIIHKRRNLPTYVQISVSKCLDPSSCSSRSFDDCSFCQLFNVWRLFGGGWYACIHPSIHACMGQEQYLPTSIVYVDATELKRLYLNFCFTGFELGWRGVQLLFMKKVLRIYKIVIVEHFYCVITQMHNDSRGRMFNVQWKYW